MASSARKLLGRKWDNDESLLPFTKVEPARKASFSLLVPFAGIAKFSSLLNPAIQLRAKQGAPQSQLPVELFLELSFLQPCSNSLFKFSGLPPSPHLWNEQGLRLLFVLWMDATILQCRCDLLRSRSSLGDHHSWKGSLVLEMASLVLDAGAFRVFLLVEDDKSYRYSYLFR